MTLLRSKISTVILASLLVVSLTTFPRVDARPYAVTRSAMRSEVARLNASDEPAKRRAMDSFDKLALRFEEVRDARNNQARFVARATGMTVGVKPTEAVMLLNDAKEPKGQPSGCCSQGRFAAERQHHISLSATSHRRGAKSLRLRLIGANPLARVAGENHLATRTNYFAGNDASQWKIRIANFERVRVEEVYPGIDVIYYGSGHQLEYDFNVAPGADFKAIRLRFSGAPDIRLSETGDLLIETANGMLRHRKPAAYQEINGLRRQIAAQYVIDRHHDVRLAVGQYDKHHSLVIDPILSYSTYLGGHQDDRINGVAVDAAGNVYVTGDTFSADFPVRSTLQPFHSLGYDVFVAKLDPTGALIYSTYLGGFTGDTATAIAVDAAGNAYVTGATGSNDFPVTAGAFQTSLAGARSVNAFIVKLPADGSSLRYSTLLGGSGNGVNGAFEFGYGIAVDTNGNAYVTGATGSVDFPTTPGAVQQALNSNVDVFVTKLNAAGSSLVYSTYLGGDNYEESHGIAVDAGGNAYVTGYTQSRDFPVTSGALQTSSTSSSLWDAFVSKLNPTGTALVYSTYFGGSNTETGNAIAVDRAGNAYVAGETESYDFPTTNNALKRKFGGGFYKSTNGGKEWHVSNAGLPTPTPSVLAVDPKTSGHLFLGTRDGLFASTNSGDSWTLRSTVLVTTLVIDPLSPTTLYAIGFDFMSASGVIKSTDGGLTWVSVTNGLPNLFGAFLLVIDPVNPLTLYVSGYGYDSSGGEAPPPIRYFFKTTDGGSSWQEIRSLFLFQTPDSLVVDPHNPSKLFLSSANLFYRTQDGGGSWRRMSDNSGYGPLAVDPNTPGLLYGIGLSVGKSTNDGRTWTASDSGLPASFVARCSAVVPTSPTTLYIGSVDGVFKSPDAGFSWQQTSLRGEIKFVGFNPLDTATIYAGSNDSSDAFVAKLNAAGSALLFSTYLGGQASDEAHCIAVDKDDNVYIGGQTDSSDFPTLNGLQSSKPQTKRVPSNGRAAGFLTKLKGSSGELLYSTYLGGDNYTVVTSIALSSWGDVNIAGLTAASDFQTQNAVQSSFAGQLDAFVLRLAAPAVGGVFLSGKRLTIVGSGFDLGAVLLVDDKEQQTSNSTNPNVRLIAKKAAVGIAPGQTVRIRVRNIDGTLSNEVLFTRPGVE